jgi:hypothetical protein
MAYVIAGLVVLAWIVSGLMADNYALRKGYKELQRQNSISLDRYNWVVGMLNEEQQYELHQYYVATGVIEEVV